MSTLLAHKNYDDFLLNNRKLKATFSFGHLFIKFFKTLACFMATAHGAFFLLIPPTGRITKVNLSWTRKISNSSDAKNSHLCLQNIILFRT